MTDLLESDLRAAFETRLTTLAPAREARLQAFDYRSRTLRRRRLIAAAGACGTAIAVGAATTVLLLTSGASTAFARWSPHASTPTPAVLAAATTACRKQPTPTTLQAPTPKTVPVTTGDVVLSETRGVYTSVIYDVRGAVYLCVTDRRTTDIQSVTPRLGGVGVLPGQTGYVAPGPDQLTVLHGSPLIFWHLVGFKGSSPVVNTIGVVGHDVSAVSITLANGITVDATVQNGWYYAWWPLGRGLRSVQVTTSSGQTIKSAWPCQTGTGTCPFVDQPPGTGAPSRSAIRRGHDDAQHSAERTPG